MERSCVEGKAASPIEQQHPRITTILFDVDDTLYDISTNFTAHRNTVGATSFMVDRLNFPSVEAAQKIRDEYFERFHSTAKGLTVAEAEGRLPRPPPSSRSSNDTNDNDKRLFDPQELSDYWANHLDFTLLNGPDTDLATMLSQCPLRLVAFSNGPRKYVLRVLSELGLYGIFAPRHIFGVDDVLPACKPEIEAFRFVLRAIGVRDPRECIMVEDSMKNIRVAKRLGMKTVLILGKGYFSSHPMMVEGDARYDAPMENDPAKDVCLEAVSEMRNVLPELWETRESPLSLPHHPHM